MKYIGLDLGSVTCGISISDALGWIAQALTTVRFAEDDYDDALNKSGKLYLYDINTKQGNKIYEKGLLLLFEVCVKEIMGNETEVIVRHSIDKGVYCEVDKKITKENLDSIKKLMREKKKI